MCSKDLRKHSNLHLFLDKTTPFVPSQSLPKASIRESNSLWQPIGRDTVECFALGDLWDQYDEWSACGLGVPIHLPDGESVVQYYVPHLSAIQLYTSKSLLSSRNAGEDSESDSWSDDSLKSWDAASEDSAQSSSFEPDGLWPAKDRIGELYLQYVESLPPYGRIPLMEKVTELARKYPGLTSLKNVELSPASWMSISWYPIYHIPARINVKDLSASFLTYHTISSSFQDSMPNETEKNVLCSEAEECGGIFKETSNRVPLPLFGLATYKMNLKFWVNPETEDNERLATLYSAVDSWLKQLRVHHKDFNYFTSHTSM